MAQSLVKVAFLLALVVSPAQAQSLQCVSPPSGLVGWWPGAGSAKDLTGTNHGTLSGGASFATGKVGQAFSFDGINGTVVVPDSSSLRLTNQVTIETWINLRTVATDFAIASKISSGTGLNGYELGIGGNNTLFAQFNSPGGFWPQFAISYASPIVTGVWYHVAWTYDQSAMKLYLNGLPVATNIIGAHAISTSSSDFRISGADNHVYFNGLIDELAVYNRALSAGEIATIYAAGSAGKCLPPILPRTATAVPQLVNGFLVGAPIDDGGAGYTNTPLVRFIGGDGTGATAAAVISNGVVASIKITNPGSGYNNAPFVVIDPPFIANPVLGLTPMSLLTFSNLAVGGSYQLQRLNSYYWTNQPLSFTAASSFYQMFAGGFGGEYRLALSPVPSQAFATAKVVNGFVVDATLIGGGSGYVSSPSVSFVGGGGSNATAMARISAGVVTNIMIMAAGIGYTNTPTIRIDPPPAAAVSPTVLPVMRLDSTSLAPYDNYQIQFKPNLMTPWANWPGGLFTPTFPTNSQFLFITNGTGFFRLQYEP